MEKLLYSLIRLPLCNIGVIWIEKWKGPKIVKISLFKKNDNMRKGIIRIFPEAKQGQNKKIDFILKRIKCYLEGEIPHFNLSDLEKVLCSKFQWDVSRAARLIPYGKVITYKGLAGLMGVRSARAAGNALAKNPFPVIIPCHRVVSSDRKIGGFQSGQNLKKALLKLEGITFDKKGRIPEEFFV